MHSIKAATINKIDLTSPPPNVTPKNSSAEWTNKKTPLTNKHLIRTIPKTSPTAAGIENKRVKKTIIKITNENINPIIENNKVLINCIKENNIGTIFIIMLRY